MIQLSDHFDFKRLIQYAFPSIIMLVFTSIYGVVDGFFVSNYVGKTSFAAVNFIMPVLMILGSAGFMFGTGGGALIALKMGERNIKKANSLFSMIVCAAAICGVILSVLGLIFIRPIASALGGSGQMLEDSILYGRIILLAIPAYILQYAFQCLFAVAQKPKLGLYVTVGAGLTNMVLDAAFVAFFNWGLVGAAAATAISQCVGGITPLIYFSTKNTSLLRLSKPVFDGHSLLKTCTNGSSELMSNISMSLVGMLYNVQLLKYAGENGVAAYGVLMYVNMIFLAVFIGYSVGTAPIISYHYGAANQSELRNLLHKSLTIIGTFAILMFVSALFLAKPLSHMFVGYDAKLMEITLHAFSIYSFSFLFAGFSILGSSFFTALGDGLTSALISFLRTLVFQLAAVLIFPLLWQLDGIWMSIVAAEIMAVVVTLIFLIVKRKKYKY